MLRLSCSAACGILIPTRGIEPSSPLASQGRFLTTGPPKKSPFSVSLLMGRNAIKALYK